MAGLKEIHMDEKSVAPKQMRGFAVMNPELVRQIAESGGRAAHRSGRAHQFDTTEARAAGKRRQELARQKRLAASSDKPDGG